MEKILNKAAQCAGRIKRLCGDRFLALALLAAVTAGTLLGVPVTAEADAETVGAATVVRCTFKLLESNLEAMDAATVQKTAVYAGEPTVLNNVTVTADDNTEVLCLEAGETVADALEAADVTLGTEDRLNVADTQYATDGLSVEVTRVTYKEHTKTQAIAFTTEVKYTNELRQGASKVSRQGVKGVKTITYRDCIENGKVVSTVKVSEKVTKAPVSKVVLKGTKVGAVVSEAPFAIALDGAGQPLNFKKKLTGKATAYTSDRGDSGTHTSCGYRAQVGIVAVNPRVIPYGTKLWIVSEDGKWVYGYAIAGDTGGGVRSGKLLVDLYFDTYGECTKFGRRTMNVYVIG